LVGKPYINALGTDEQTNCVVAATPPGFPHCEPGVLEGLMRRCTRFRSTKANARSGLKGKIESYDAASRQVGVPSSLVWLTDKNY
jgi:hypothetical protein